LEKIITENPRLLWSEKDYSNYLAKISPQSEKDLFEAQHFRIVFFRTLTDKENNVFHYIGAEINEVVKVKENGVFVKKSRTKIIYEYKNGKKTGATSSGTLSGCDIKNPLLSQLKSDKDRLKELQNLWAKSIDPENLQKFNNFSS
jgi:uncharacterized membrane protein